MGIKYNETKKGYLVTFSKRHAHKPYACTLKRFVKGSKRDAEKVYCELVLEVEQRIKSYQVPRWSQLINDYGADALERGLAKDTVENSLLCLKAYTVELWGNRLADEISTTDIRHLLTSIERSESHKKNILKFIRNVFSYGIGEGLVKTNPAPNMKFKSHDKIKAVLTRGEVLTLLSAARRVNHLWYPHWATALYTGMRNGELYALTWDKVDFENNLIKVDCSWNNKDGFKSTKSGDDRLIEIAAPLKAVLSELKLKYGAESKFVLPRIDRWDKGEQARELQFFLTNLGLPMIRFHDLRATWATILLGLGVEPAKVMKMGGWKDLKTMQFYIRKAGVDIKGSTDKLDLHDPSASEGKVLSFKDAL